MNIEQIRLALADRMPRKVAAATGIHYNTIREVRDNVEANPTLRVIKALSGYFERQREEQQQGETK